MKSSKIYVGARLSLSNGVFAVAVFPPQKGDAVSYMLSEGGKLIQVKGARINGLGVPKYLESQGFRLAQAGDPQADELAALLDAKEGCRLFETATADQVRNYQAWLAGKSMKVIPYDPAEEPYTIKVEAPSESITTVADMQAGLAVGGLRIEYQSPRTDRFTVLQGWLVGLDEPYDPLKTPRCTEYGGVVEHACYLVCAAGLAVLDGAAHLEDNIEEVKDVPYPRGFLRLLRTDAAILSKDVLVVGITGTDTLEVAYERDGQVLYQRQGLSGVRLRNAVEDIMAVVVRVAEMDAASAKAKVKRRA